MAYFRKLASGRWQAQVERAGQRVSQGGFDTKAQAQAWAAAQESDLLAGKRGQYPRKTLGQAIDRYEAEISSRKATKAFEEKRFEALRRDHAPLLAKLLVDVTSDDLGRWRDARLKLVKESTVRRELNTLRNVWTVASTEWRWCPTETPWKFVRKPEDSQPRTRRISWRESRLIMRRLGYRSAHPPETKQQELAYAWLIALRTAMRAGEILGLQVADVDLAKRVVRLGKHKTMRYTQRPRYVPVTRRAAAVLAMLVDQAKKERREALFTLGNSSRDALFREITRQLMIADLRFHDSRAEALTLLARRVDVMTLARISGHQDINLLNSTYYRETPEEIAARL